MIAENGSQRPSGFEVSRLAWGSLFTAIRKMPLLILSSMVAVFLITFVQFKSLAIFPPNVNPQSLATTAEFAVRSIIGYAVMALVVAPVAVAVHRLILLGETTPGVISLKPLHTRKFVIWMVLLELISISNTSNFISPLLRVALFILSLVVGVRLILLFPALAIDAPVSDWKDRLKKSWHQTRGNFWLIFRSEFIAFLPFIVILPIGIFISVREIYLGVRDANSLVAHFNSSSLGLMMAFSSAIYGPIGIALAAAVASWIYKWVIASGKSAQNM